MAAAAPLVPGLRSVRAVVLGTGKAVTDSARMHTAAWKKACDARLATHPGQRPFEEKDDHRRRHGADVAVGDPGEPLTDGEDG